ncbi:hypothetical protein VH571_15225 [Frondihabitans sp. 4ASC-45]|uniref:hypothetical protein n=1 Tax=Frondihabitans sp. 4ASC-45 TaxID=3111636 RepID=UPI003C28D2F1
MKKHPRSRQPSERPTFLVLGVVLASICTLITWFAASGIATLTKKEISGFLHAIVGIAAHLSSAENTKRIAPEIEPGNEGFPFILLVAGILFVVTGVAFLIVSRLFGTRRPGRTGLRFLRRARSTTARRNLQPAFRRRGELIEDGNMLLPEWPPPAALTRLHNEIEVSTPGALS